MHEQDPHNQTSHEAQEDILEIPDYIESLNGQAMQYLQTVRADLERLYPHKDAEIEAFARSQIRSNLVLRDGLSSQQYFYNTHDKVREKYDERLQDIYNGSLTFDRELTEPEAAEEERIKTEAKELEQENRARIAQEDPTDGTSLQVVNYEQSMPVGFEREIAEAQAFQDMYDALIKSKHIIGTKGVYTAQEMINLIESYRNTGSEDALIQITRTGGLRERVFELYQLERPEEEPQAEPTPKKPLPDRATSGPRPVITVDSSPTKKPAKGLKKFFGGFFKLFS